MTPARTPTRERLTWALAWTAVVFYLATAHLAAARNGDFTHLWVGGAAWLEGGAYDPTLQHALLDAALDAPSWAPRNEVLGAFFYPPTALLLYAPLGLLSLQHAALLMAFLNVALGVCAGWLLGRLTPLGTAVGIAVVLLFPGFFFAYALGQNGPLTLCLILGAVLASRKGRPLLAGLLLGALAFKPSWLLAASWLWIVMPRPKRVLLGMAAAIAALTVASLPTGAWGSFLDLAPSIATLPSQGDYPVHLQYDLQSLGLRVGPAWPGWLAAFGVVVVTCMRGRGRLPAALLAVTLANPHLHAYDALPALLGAAALTSRRRGWWAIVALHVAFLVTGAVDASQILALPTLAMLGLWAWSLFGPAPREVD